MLNRLLRELAQIDGPIDLRTLARRLDVEPGALAGMLQFWERKGRLRDARLIEGQPGPACHSGCGSCPAGPNGCPFIINTPRALIPHDPPPDR